ncbi:MAG: hypothetical protein IJS67_00690, partial [Clostridia bacterium]|nr:hypothetical protein [Clostridia bacterium]
MRPLRNISVKGFIMQKTIYFKSRPALIATATVAGPKEGAGGLGKYIEKVLKDDTFGEKTFEKA